MFRLLVIFWFLQTALSVSNAMDIILPPLAQAVQQANTIVRGHFSVDGTNAVFIVDSVVKGDFLPFQAIAIMKDPMDIFFDVVRYATKLQGQSCYILGNRNENELHLIWSYLSIWPQGISRGTPDPGHGYPALNTIEECEAFINEVMAQNESQE